MADLSDFDVALIPGIMVVKARLDQALATLPQGKGLTLGLAESFADVSSRELDAVLSAVALLLKAEGYDAFIRGDTFCVQRFRPGSGNMGPADDA